MVEKITEFRFTLCIDDLSRKTFFREIIPTKIGHRHAVVIDLTQLKKELAEGALAAEVLEELGRAPAKFPSFNSAHEGYAVLLEEIDELWEEIKQKEKDHPAIREEAIQVAAMAIRFIRDVCDK